MATMTGTDIQKDVVDWFAEATFNIQPSGDQTDLFTPEHTRFAVRIEKSGESYETDYQCNTAYTQPTPFAVMQSVASDALEALNYDDIDDFANEMGFDKPSKAIKAWQGCKESCDALTAFGFSESEQADLSIGDLANYLDQTDEAEFNQMVEARRKELDLDKPELPDGWSYIEDLQADLDLGEYGEELADYSDYIGDAIGEVADSNIDIYTADLKEWIMEDGNDQWLEEAKAQGLLEGTDDFTKMIQMAQYECFTADLYKHQEDAVRYAIYEHIKDEHGAVAISDELAERIGDIDCSDNNNRFSALFDKADEALSELLEEDGTKRYTMTKEQARQGGKEPIPYEVYEDNAGHLYLVVLDPSSGTADWAMNGYEEVDGLLADKERSGEPYSLSSEARDTGAAKDELSSGTATQAHDREAR